MIVAVDRSNIEDAARVHALSWRASHRPFCLADFLDRHTPERQRSYLEGKIEQGTGVWLLVDREPVGLVSVTGNLIEDLYVLPGFQNRGYGTQLLRHAMGR